MLFWLMAHSHARTVSLKLKVFALMVIITTLKKAVFEALTTFCGNIKLGGSSVSFSIDTQISTFCFLPSLLWA